MNQSSIARVASWVWEDGWVVVVGVGGEQAYPCTYVCTQQDRYYDSPLVPASALVLAPTALALALATAPALRVSSIVVGGGGIVDIAG